MLFGVVRLLPLPPLLLLRCVVSLCRGCAPPSRLVLLVGSSFGAD